jgi:hypothetical protein
MLPDPSPFAGRDQCMVHSSFMRLSVGSRGMFVSKLAMLMSRGCVLLGIFVLAACVVMVGLMMMMRRGVVVSGR